MFPVFSDPLPSAVLLAFKAIRMHVSKGKSTMFSECMRLCQTASGLLKQSVALPLTTEETIDDELTKVTAFILLINSGIGICALAWTVTRVRLVARITANFVGKL